MRHPSTGCAHLHLLSSKRRAIRISSLRPASEVPEASGVRMACLSALSSSLRSGDPKPRLRLGELEQVGEGGVAAALFERLGRAQHCCASVCRPSWASSPP